jgi:outer membrane protein assembly factor BamB
MCTRNGNSPKDARPAHRQRIALAVVTVLALVVARASAIPVSALWSRYVTGGVEGAKIDQGVVIFGVLQLDGDTSTQGFDARTGRTLWKRTGALPLAGSSLFLAVGTTVEHVNARTGREIWRSAPLCGKTAIAPKSANFQPPAVALPTYAAAIGKSLYVGCNGGKIFALRLSDGHLFASAYPAYLDNYDQIVSLGHGALGIGGGASGAYMYRQSAIVRRDTLSTIVVFGPGHRIIAAGDGAAIVADECCRGAHDDSWPANIERVSLASGETESEVSLRPYPHPLPPDHDRPGPGLVLAVRNDLYVATHSALFLYDLRDLRARPRVLYEDLVDLPSMTDQRYLTVEEGKPGSVKRVAVLDAYNGMRVIRSSTTSGSQPSYSPGSTRELLIFSGGYIRPVTVDASCSLAASSDKYAFTVCTSLDITARAQLGGPARSASVGERTENPESIAVYALLS